MKVKIVSGCMTGKTGVVIKRYEPDDFGLNWNLIKVDGIIDPIYYIDDELEILH